MSVIRFLSMVVLLVGLDSPAAAQQPAAKETAKRTVRKPKAAGDKA